MSSNLEGLAAVAAELLSVIEERDRLRELLREAYSASVCKVERCEECEEIAKKIDAALGGEKKDES